MITATDRVTLILDVLGHEETELFGQPALWRHRDGRFLTDDEVDIVADITVGDIRHAMELWHEELLHMKEQASCALSSSLSSPVRGTPASRSSTSLTACRKLSSYRAAELWQRIGPEFEARWSEQS